MHKAKTATSREITSIAMARVKPSSCEQRHIELLVGGMTCTHCPPAVEKALKV